MEITGRIESGKGEAWRFTELDWVVAGIEREAGFRPYPGTLNVRANLEHRSRVEALFAIPDFQLLSKESQYCSAVLKRVLVAGLPALAVLPSEEVRAHGADVVELIAERSLRQALMLRDGDQVTISDVPSAHSAAIRSAEYGSDIRRPLRYPQAVVFDVDGTLVDSITLYYEGFERLAATVGIHFRRDEVMQSLSTGTFRLEQVIPFGTTSGEQQLIRLRELMPSLREEVVAQAPLFPWVPAVLAGLARTGLGLGLVTSSPDSALAPLRAGGLLHLFGATVVRGDELSLKPAPDGVLACLDQLHTKPKHAWVVGDSPLDIQAGKAAGTWTVAVLGGIADRATLEAENPDAIVVSVADLPALLRRRRSPE